MMPVRVQLRRRKGWRLPPNAVVVSRPSRHGNPFKVIRWGKSWGVLRAFRLGSTVVAGFEAADLHDTPAAARRRAVTLYCEAIDDGLITPDLEALRGKDLACWCPLDEPCHADRLLILANLKEPPAHG